MSEQPKIESQPQQEEIEKSKALPWDFIEL